MKTFLKTPRRFANCKLVSTLRCGFLLVLALNAPQSSWAADTAKSFTTPEEAVAALTATVQSPDRAALRALFGPAHEDIQNPDREQATNEFTAFAGAFAASHYIARESDAKCVLEVGANAWPFPIPLVQRDGRWLFDTAAGKEEILSRRIGKNELAVLESMRAYVDAQREYASRDRDGDEVLEYAQRLGSSPGTKDGLFWPPDLDGEISPLGPLVAEAQGEGYAMRSKGALPGERSEFIMELPPLRLPQLRNIVRKTLLRVRWYLGEAVPLFLIGTGLLFVLSRLGALTKLTAATEPVVVGLLGLPRDASAVFIMGFLRRDYGAAGLFQMSKAGELNGVQAVVALTVMTLFVPCVANFLMMVKEQGLRAALGILGAVTVIALGTGAVLNLVLRGLDVAF